MKRVLIAIHTLQMGGVEKIVINLLKNIDKEKFDVTLLSIVNDGIYINEVKKIPNIKYKYFFNSLFKKSRDNTNSPFNKITSKIMNIIWKYYLFMIKYFPKYLYKKNIKEKYDIEISFLEGKVAKIIANSPNHDSKKMVWIHTDIENICRMNIFKSLQEEIDCYNKFDKIVCVSSDVKNHFIHKTGITENILIQTNPINSEEIIEKSKEKILENLKKDGLVLCAVGRLAYEKGFDRLLKIHKRLLSENIKNTVWIVGEGGERKRLEKYISANNLENTVDLIGYTSNPYKYIKNADIFVCSSRIEGLSSVVIEATILEKPIVTTMCSGMTDILGEDNENAMIVSNNTDDLYLGIKKMITDNELRRTYENNIKNISNEFNINHVIKNIENLLDSLEKKHD